MGEKLDQSLITWGWDQAFAAAFAASAADRSGLTPARVILEQPRTLHLVHADGETVATTSGRLRHHAKLRSDLPAVGDWVGFRPATGTRAHATVELVVPRRSKLSRKVAGLRTDEQVVAANVDRVFLLMGLDGDYNPNRVARYLLMFREAGVEGIVVLNKLDLAPDADAKIAEIQEVAPNVPVVAVSCKHEQQLEQLERWLERGSTIALVGSSGVGKSTLVNRLLGSDRVATGEVRLGDDRGQHTTRHRELVLLPSGAILVDNPGIRELQPWVGEDALEATFEDILELARHCRFADCGHRNEPGCAVQAAIADGTSSAARLASFRALQEQVSQLGARQKGLEQQLAKRKLASIHRAHDRYRPRE